MCKLSVDIETWFLVAHQRKIYRKNKY